MNYEVERVKNHTFSLSLYKIRYLEMTEDHMSHGIWMDHMDHIYLCSTGPRSLHFLPPCNPALKPNNPKTLLARCNFKPFQFYYCMIFCIFLSVGTTQYLVLLAVRHDKTHIKVRFSNNFLFSFLL